MELIFDNLDLELHHPITAKREIRHRDVAFYSIARTVHVALTKSGEE
jgi:hypothetical protein